MAVRALLMRFGVTPHPGFKSRSLRSDLRFRVGYAAPAAGFPAPEPRAVTPRSHGLLPGPSALVRRRPGLFVPGPVNAEVSANIRRRSQFVVAADELRYRTNTTRQGGTTTTAQLAPSTSRLVRTLSRRWHGAGRRGASR